MPVNLTTIRQRPAISEIQLSTQKREPTLYATQWLWSKQTIRLIDSIVQSQRTATIQEKSHSSARLKKNSASSTKLTENKWGFKSQIWDAIVEEFQSKEKLYAAIKERHEQIIHCREFWRSFIQTQQSLNPFYLSLAKISGEIASSGTYQIAADQMELCCDGISGAYFLSDYEGNKRFVVKPIDEDIDCLNNGKDFASPYIHSTIRDNIPLYLSSLRETLSYEIACQIKCSSIAPRTVLAIMQCDAFHDHIDQVDPNERVQYERYAGSPNKEKLCSVQEYIPNSKPLSEALQDLQMAKLSDDEIEARFDQRDIEDAHILLWTTFETDGHMSNFLVYPKSSDSVGNEILGIKKIDNSLTFPEKNEQLRNNLRYLPNAERPLSTEGRSKIAAISIESIVNQMKKFGLEGSIEALRQRLTVLKELAQRKNLSLREIDYRMSLIGKPNGIELALMDDSEKNSTTEYTEIEQMMGKC